MQAYHNDIKVKEKYINRVIAHRKADQLIKGTGWDAKTQKGCAIGCTLESYDHTRYPIELGIPIHLAKLEDKIFEGLSIDLAMQWPERFLQAVNVGADLEMVWPKFVLWVLEDVIQYAREDGKKVISNVIALYKQWILGNKPSIEDFKKAAAAAADAADADAADAADADAADADAAYAAAYAADAAADAAYAADAAADAAYAADAAADAAAAAYAADADAAYAAAYAADADAADADAAYAAYHKAKHRFWERASDKLIELIEEVKVSK